MLQFSKASKRFFAALLGVLLILNSLSILNPAVVYGAEGDVVESSSEEQEDVLAEDDVVEEDEIVAPDGDSEEVADEEAESEDEPAEDAEEGDPVEDGSVDDTEGEAAEDEVVDEEEAAEAEEEEEAPAEEAEEEIETLEEEEDDLDGLDYPKYQADNDGITVLAFSSDIHNGHGGTEVANNRLTTWLSNVMPKYNNNIGVFGFCGDMGGGDTSSSTFWTYTKNVMNNIDTHNMSGIYAVGNHEYMNGSMASTTNSPEVREKYTLNAEGRAVSNEDYVIYCLGTNSSHGSSWAYDDSQITSLTNYVNSVSNDKVIIILTHFPLHDYGMHRTSNTDPILKALNAAAVGSDGTYGTADDKKIVFLWGHNHSEGDTNYDQVWGPGDVINDNNKSTVYFFYAAAGAMADTEYGSSGRVLGKGLVLTINSKKQLSFTYYDASGNNVTEGGTYTEQDPTPATAVSIDEKNPSVDEGRKIQLHLTYTPSDANANLDVTWSSSNTSIATVNQSGVVTGVKEGNATITVTAKDNSYSASTTVTVNHNDNPTQEVTVAITPSTDNPEENIEINVGDTLIVNVTNGSSNSAYDFTASLSKNGVVSAESSATQNIAAGATAQFVFTGVDDGVVNITIQNTNQYGSQYVRKGVVHVTVGEGGDTPVDPPVGDTVNITPSTENPEESIKIAVGDTLTINVTNGSSNSAYDFTASLSKSGVVSNTGSSTVNIGMGETGQFTFEGLTDGTVDITIQNNSQYGSQYVRKGVIHVTVGEGGDTPIDPPTGDHVDITPSTENPEESIKIAVEDVLTINVTNGSSNSAYDFTATLSGTGVAEIQGSTTINIAAGATAQFYVKGLKEGTVDITIQNENSYGSQYVRKGIIHLTVGDVTPPEPGEGTNYKLVDKLSANKEYLIVNRNTAGSGYALTSPGGTESGATMGRTSVTVQSGDVDGDGKSDIYITSEATAIVWKTSAEFTILTDDYGDFGQGFDLSNATPGGYLEGRQGDVKVYSALSYNVTGNRRGWRYITESNQLQHVGGQNTYKIVYSNGNFVDEYNDTTIRTYIFEKVDGAPTPHTHDWGAWTVTTPATCTEAGVETRTCSGCGATETREIAATGHDFGDWTVTTPATCSAEGVETRTCSKCGATETRAIEKIAHTYGEPEWTWTGSDADGYTAAVAKFTCSVCSDVQTVNATVTSTETSAAIIYIATVAFQGKAYSDTKTVSTIPPTYELSETSIEVANGSTYQLTLNGSDGTVGEGTWVSSDEKIATVDENGLVTAVKYGKATITVTFVSDGEETTATCEVQTRFSDVTDKGDYFYKAVYWAADHKPVITAGYTDGSFGVGDACTREQFILFIYRLANQPKVSDAELKAVDSKFKDASDLSSNTFKKAVAWGVKEGIIKGYTSGENAGKFMPANSVTRQEALLMLWRYAGKPSAKETDLFKSFKDLKGVKKTSDTYNSIKWSVAKNISKGYAAQENIPAEYQDEFEAPCFGTTMECQRQDLILFLYRYAK